MFYGTEDALAWFRRTGKTGFRLSRGKDVIAEYFEQQASNESAAEALHTELSYLKGGTYHIDAKNQRTDAKTILSTDFVISPSAGTQAAVGSIHQGVPEGYISKADLGTEIAKALKQNALERENKELRESIMDLQNAKPNSGIAGLLDHPLVQHLLPIAIAKIMGPNAPQALGQVGIAGITPAQQVPPVQQQTPEAGENTDTEELTEEQDAMLGEAFWACVDEMGSIDDTLELLACLPRYIAANKQVFDTMIKPELLKYKENG